MQKENYLPSALYTLQRRGLPEDGESVSTRSTIKTVLKVWTAIAITAAAVLSLFANTCVDAQASDSSGYLGEYISHFNNLNNGSVSYSMDSDGRYRIDKKDDSEFKVLQLADIHLTGYDENNGWKHDPNLWENDKNLTNCDRQEILAVYRIIEKTRPDLIVLTGDTIYGGDFNTISGNKRALDALIRMMNRIHVPWIYLMGNHDHHFADGYMGENCRDYLYSKLRQANSLLFYDRYKPFYASDSGDFTGAPEYMYGSYKLYNQNGSFNSVIIGLDSGSNDIYNDNYDYIYDSQVNWYESEIRSIAAENGLSPAGMNSYLYYHIPLNIAEEVANNGTASSYNYGSDGESGGCSKHSDPLWDRVLSLGSTRTMSYGHNHSNDLWFTYKGIDFLYGKSIEYSVYNTDATKRGGTEIHVRQNKSYYITENSLNDFNKNSFVLEADGTWRWENDSNTIDPGYTGWGWNGYEEAYMKDGTLVWNGGSGDYTIAAYSNPDYSVAVQNDSSGAGANIDLEKTADAARQELFYFERMSDGIYTIKTFSSGLSSVLTAESTDNGANVIQSAYTGSNLQQWKAVKNSDGSVSFLLSADPSKALDIAGSLPVSGTRNVHIYSYNSSNPDTAGFTAVNARYWKYQNGSYYLYDVNGKKLTGWQLMNGLWYYLNSDGTMATGWRYIGGKWYYLEQSGAMAIGWRWINGAWYYLDDNGMMAAGGWHNINGSWYYMYSDGVMATGWLHAGARWYYMNSSGAMMTGWQEVNGTWYYLTSSGAMAYREYYGGYWLNADGSWTYPYTASWKLTDGRWWYGDDTGWYAKNQTLWIDGTAYGFDAEGYLQ